MTIDEAIKQAKDNASFYLQFACDDFGSGEEHKVNTSEEIAKSMFQIAKWLEELKDLREYKGKVEWVIKTHKQIKEETIDKCIEIISNADVDIFPSRDIILRDLEKLKEQSNE